MARTKQVTCPKRRAKPPRTHGQTLLKQAKNLKESYENVRKRAKLVTKDEGPASALRAATACAAKDLVQANESAFSYDRIKQGIVKQLEGYDHLAGADKATYACEIANILSSKFEQAVEDVAARAGQVCNSALINEYTNELNEEIEKAEHLVEGEIKPEEAPQLQELLRELTTAKHVLENPF